MIAHERSEERIPELDGLRGLAVLLVMAYHGFAYEMARESWSGLGRVVLAVTSFGWLGVDLFFVLSGFLITGVLLRERGRPHALRNFYARRALRILPLYFAVLLVILLAYRDAAAFVGLSALFLANMVTLFGVPLVYGPLWSLAVEEHFYLLWPWLVRVAAPRTLMIAAGAVAVGEPLARAAGFAAGWDTYYFSWFRFDGLAWGALLALAAHRHNIAWGKAAGASWATATLLLLLGLPYGLGRRQEMLGAALLYSTAQLFFVGLLALVLATSGSRWAGVWRQSWLRRCGDWSYCLYLIHLMLLEAFDWAAAQFNPPPAHGLSRYGLRALTAFAAAFLLAALSFRCFESPILRLKRRLR